jgi:phage terminase large subunit-like protein
MSNIINWILLPWQLLLWSSGARFQVVCAGRRCGKSNYAIKRCLAEALKAPKGAVVGYVGPTAAQSKQIGYDAMMEEAREFIKTSNSNAGDILLNNGVKICFRSAEAPDGMRGLKLAFCVLDEIAFYPGMEMWTRTIRPALSDLRGGALFISSPNGFNGFYDLYMYALESGDPEWSATHLTTYDNPTIDKAEIEAARRTMSAYTFEVEFMASFTTPGSDIFKDELFKLGKAHKYGDYVIAGDLAGFGGEYTSEGKKSKNDESALAVVKISDEGKWHVEKILAGRWSVRETVTHILALLRKYKPVAFGIERGMSRNAVMDTLEIEMRRFGVFINVQELTHGNQKKVDRITYALQAKFEHGQITFNEDEDWTEVRKQLSMFPSPTSKDDRIDALAYAAQLATVTFISHYEEVEHEVLDPYIGY